MRIPIATYRLQFNADFGFQAAAQVIAYLADLGVSDVYASPVFQARKASRHGYDITDARRINPELGGTSEFETLTGMVKAYRMGWLQVIVPNHMAFDQGNPMLMDVFENGAQSSYYNFFDIDWDHPAENMKGRLLAPFLGRPYGESLENGEIKLKFDDAGFSIQHYRQRFPVKIETFVAILADLLAEFEKRPKKERPIFTALQKLWRRLNALCNKEMDALQKQQLLFIKSALWDIYCTRQTFRQLVEKTLRAYNGRKGFPESFNALDGLLGRQIYRLAYWKVAAAEINYRRFFDINELIALRAENEEVFNHIHDLILRLSRKKQFSGLRIDHIDGLYD
ncbi:MAG: alpha-amylase family glycosyl hydrolase, partial [Bacteroidales bacterium]|nr:alpha-amylase family glycosyl hydrolase [Bacteroidales bacterium]